MPPDIPAADSGPADRREAPLDTPSHGHDHRYKGPMKTPMLKKGEAWAAKLDATTSSNRDNEVAIGAAARRTYPATLALEGACVLGVADGTASSSSLRLVLPAAYEVARTYGD